MPFAGTLINAASILIFASLGSLVRRGIPERFSRAILSAVAICVVYIGIDGALEAPSAELRLPDAVFNTDITGFVTVIVSLTVGTFIGELINIDKLVCRLGEKIEKRLGAISRGSDKEKTGGGFAKGFVSCTIMTCVGAMAVNGAILDAVGEPGVLIAKSVIDAIACFIMASSFGIGCAFAALPMLLYQGVITLAALAFSAVIPPESIYYLSVTGSLIIVLIGTNLLGATDVKTANMTPAVFMPLILTPIFGLF